MNDTLNELVEKFRTDLAGKVLTLGEFIELSESEDASLSLMVVAETMAREGKGYDAVLDDVLAAFTHNFKGLEVGLKSGRSFLLGTVGSDLNRYSENVLIDDDLINRALVYTLATEVGNHEIGLQPCAGTGDSCPYTGLVKALLDQGVSRQQVARAAALILKVGSFFRAAKRTTGCNMEGYGAGAAATAAALTDLRGGTARQVAQAIVLALSQTIGVPCTPRVMAQGLCATHISGAILIGNQAANLVLKTSLPVDIDVDVMLAMAARVHVEAAPVISKINLAYLEPYFQKRPQVESFINESIRQAEQEQMAKVLANSREEIRRLAQSVRPVPNVFGDVVVGGSSIAVGSPTNMARICHAMISGEIRRIDIDLTTDLFKRRAINVPAILMAAIYGARTDDAKMYHEVFERPEYKKIDIRVNHVEIPEVQRIRIEATGRNASVDARNRGGGRVAIRNAEPSLEEALNAARKLGIEIARE